MRLSSSRSFLSLYQRVKKPIRLGRFAFYACENNLTYPRLGMSISKHHVPKAVQRNYLKRVNRACFYERRALLKGLDIIVRLKSPVRDLTRAQLYQHIVSQWDQLLICYER